MARSTSGIISEFYGLENTRLTAPDLLLSHASGDQNPSLVEMELKVLDFWEKHDIFRKSLDRNRNADPYIFYDGPPFATGLPHHGHLVASTIKDVVPRYWSMKGRYVLRRFGWDCHGLPIEYEIDKELGMSAGEALHHLGVKGYNDKCRKIVQRYTSEWRRTISRIGRWVDFDNDYKTMDTWYMESVWWVFKQVWDKGLVYKGLKVMPVSTALGTVLSNFEAASNYRMVVDPSVSVLFRLEDEDACLMTWTTTPWTLPANQAICVGPDIDYLKVRDTKRNLTLYLAAARLPDYDRDGRLQVLAQLKGRTLLGRRYQPMFPYFARLAEEGAFVVLGDDYVTDGEGTGLVHQAPAFGEDDWRIYQAAGMKSCVCPVDRHGVFTEEVKDFAGLHVKEADPRIILWLDAHGALYRHEQIRHSYPFCYRSDTPLIYRVIDSWYINVTRIKERLIAANRKVRWVPGHIRDGRFGKWLEGAKDWAVSRNRVWGTPVPIWINDTTGTAICVGSLDELEHWTDVRVPDLHREFVDDLTFRKPGEPGVYRRVEEVLDCWFESGSMPYAQLHYPFANQATFAGGFPAEFIAEGLDQTRGWFYTLMVLSTALFDRPAFSNVIVNGMVMAADGKKMSKRLRNYTAPDALMAEYGADALRLYLIDSNLVKGEEQRFADAGVRDMTRRILLPWYNACRFLQTYLSLDRWHPVNDAGHSDVILDRWILSELQSLKRDLTHQMAHYQLYKVVPVLLRFIENLTNWYIRLNRGRFWGAGMSVDKCAAYTTLYTVMRDFSLIMAPFAPFLAETLYQRLRHLEPGSEQPESVHLCTYPEADRKAVDPSLERAVEWMQKIVLLGRRQRERNRISLRTPLSRLTVIHKDKELLAEIARIGEVLKQELNIKEVVYETEESKYISWYAKPNFPLLGKRVGRRMKHVQRLIQGLSSQQLEDFLERGYVELDGERFDSEEISVFREAKAGTDCVTDRQVSIVLDCHLNEGLIAEGWAREAVHLVQGARKSLQFEVSNRIVFDYDGDAPLLEAIGAHGEYIAGEVLATRMRHEKIAADTAQFTERIGGYRFRFRIERVGV